jgi:hypothetical protein
VLGKPIARSHRTPRQTSKTRPNQSAARHFRPWRPNCAARAAARRARAATIRHRCGVCAVVRGGRRIPACESTFALSRLSEQARMLPKSVHAMLRMEANWMRWHAGGVTHALYKQVRSQRARAIFADAIISASFDLANAATIRRFGRLRRVRQVSGFKWRIGDLSYLYYPAVDDTVLFRWLDFKRRNREFTIIVPPDHDCLFRDALRTILPKSAPIVFGLDGFLSWRATFASIDLSLGHEETILWLLHRYNRRIIRLRERDTLTIDVSAISYMSNARPRLSRATPRPS